MHQHRMCMLALLSAGLLAVLATALPEQTTAHGGKRTLVFMDDLLLKKTHSRFFANLESRGHVLTFASAKDGSVSLQKYGEWLYDNLVLFAPSVNELQRGIDVAPILEFVDAGHNIIVAGDIGAGSPIRELASECGVDFDEGEKNAVVDHVNYDRKDEGDHTLVYSEHFIESSMILGDNKLAPVLFRGVGMIARDNTLVLPILTANPTSFAHDPALRVASSPMAIGSQTLLVAGMQARNNARIIVSGSIELFSDEFFGWKVEPSVEQQGLGNSGNAQFCAELATWTFQERGVLRAFNVKYSASSRPDPLPKSVQVKDTLDYSVTVEQWDGKDWSPFHATDLQLEFVMLDPYQRRTLTSDKKGVYSTQFQAPDVYGVFQFVLRYEKLGLTTLDLRHQVTVLPLKHDQYERFIVAAYPYYASAFSMMAAFFLFNVLFLYSGTQSKAKPE